MKRNPKREMPHKQRKRKKVMGMFEDFYEVVKKIPAGKVASYGFVSRAAGHKGKARQVGWALHVNPDQSTIPCHRVVKIDGSLSESFAFGGINVQEQMLLREGVEVVDGKVDMKKYSLDFA